MSNIYEVERAYHDLLLESIFNQFRYAPSWASFVRACDVDEHLKMLFGLRELTSMYDNMFDGIELDFDGRRYIYQYLVAKETQYNKIYAIATADYNPLENYHMTESESVVDDTDNMYGTETTTDNTSHGEVTTHNEYDYGQSQDSTNYGNRIIDSTQTDKNAPFDSETYYNNKQITDSNTQNSYTDTTTQNARHDESDSQTGAHTVNSTLTKNAHNDTFYKEVERNLERYGNIGVTTTQQMALSELELATKLNLTEIIAHDIADLISKGVYLTL